MIGDIIGQSLRHPSRLIPVEALLWNCHASRMPDILPDRLTSAIAQKLVEVCPTAALGLEECEGHPCLKLSYGQCIGCGKCIEFGEGAVGEAKDFTRCGVTKERTIRRWNIERRAEVI